jgi:hypothetical protein
MSDKQDAVVDDLRMLVQRLVHALNKASPDNDLGAKALDYLVRKGLTGSILRDDKSAEQDRIDAAVKRFDDHMALIGGCTDGGCVIVKPQGMHTNGGCRCPKDPQKMQRAMFAAITLRNALKGASK